MSARSRASHHRRRNDCRAWVALAVGLAGLALINRRMRRQTERASPPAGRLVQVDGAMLHYLEQGRGEPVVFIHGDGALSQDFVASRVFGMAAERYRAIAFDRPGSGYSTRSRRRIWGPRAQAEALAQALQQLVGEQPVVVVGHSWGTLVALALALAHPGRVRGLVLASGYYFPTLRLDAALLIPAALPVVGTVLRHTVAPWLVRAAWPLFRRRIFAPAPIPERFLEQPLDLLLRPGQLRAVVADSLLTAPAALWLSRDYGRITVPTVLLAGSGDRMVSTAHHSRRLAPMLPRARLQLLEGAGHMVHYFSPRTMLEAIDEVGAGRRSVNSRGGE